MAPKKKEENISKENDFKKNISIEVKRKEDLPQRFPTQKKRNLRGLNCKRKRGIALRDFANFFFLPPKKKEDLPGFYRC